MREFLAQWDNYRLIGEEFREEALEAAGLTD